MLDGLGEGLHLLQHALGLATDDLGHGLVEHLAARTLGRQRNPVRPEGKGIAGGSDRLLDVGERLRFPSLIKDPPEVGAELLLLPGRVGAGAPSRLDAGSEAGYQLVDVGGGSAVGSHVVRIVHDGDRSGARCASA